MRGASRGVLGVEQARRPRAWFAATHSGGAGAPPGGTRTPREELADGGPLALSQAQKARPGAARKRRDGAPKGATHRKRCVH